MDDAELRVICGPTGAGKSALAMALAGQRDVAIISADSRQVYRGFDIGTAKPTPAERARVPHFGVDVADPHERYSAARWASAADRWIADAQRAGRVPLVVGGTGFYIGALVRPLFVEPSLDRARVEQLRARMADTPNAELHRWCERLDPERASLGRAQLRRAIEVALLTGVPLSEWHRRSPGARPRAARYLLVDPGAVLREWIAQRLDRMIEQGWEREVAALDASTDDDAPAWKGSGYRAIRERIRGRVTLEAALERAFIDTRQYAKRQRTWYRHQLPRSAVTTIDPTRDDALRTARRWLDGEGTA